MHNYAANYEANYINDLKFRITIILTIISLQKSFLRNIYVINFSESSQWSVAQWLAQPLLVPEIWVQIPAGLLCGTLRTSTETL